MSPGQHEQSSGQVAHPHHLKGTARSLVTVVVHGYGGTPCTLHQWTTLGLCFNPVVSASLLCEHKPKHQQMFL